MATSTGRMISRDNGCACRRNGTRNLRVFRRAKEFSKLRAIGDSGGSGVLEKPGFDLGGRTTPEAEAGGASGREIGDKRTGRGDHFRVLLLDHPGHTEKLVVDVLPKIIPAMDEEYAKNCFHTSKKLGQALVCICMKEHAEFYAQLMYKYGCRAAIEPDYSAI